MHHYYLDERLGPDGNHKVHRADCDYLPGIDCRIYLGEFATSRDALKSALADFPKCTACKFCLNECIHMSAANSQHG